LDGVAKVMTGELTKSAQMATTQLSGVSKSVDEKTKAIKAGLLVEQSEIELQRQHLAASQAEQQARLQAAQAKGDEAAATRAQNALAQIEADQLNLVARLKRSEATAIQQATAARREELAAIGPLTAAQAAELMKLVEEGKIAASDLFPALAKGLNELYGAAGGAQTLSQELTNVKNAVTDMAANIGDAGGLSALKVAAEIAQGAIVGLDAGLVAAGKSIGVVLAALASWDFSGLKQSFADIEKEAKDKVLKAAQHNDTLRNSLKNSGDEAIITALAQQELANKTGAVSAAALAGASDFVKLQNGYRIVRESIVEQITAQEKSVIARDAEGKAAVALANAFGTETEQRQALAAAAAASAAELERLAALKLQELATMQAELQALQEEAAQRGVVDEAKAKQMAELEKAIALRQQETDKAVAQAGAIAQQRAIFEVARAKGDEVGAMRAANEIRKLEIQLLQLTAQAKRAEAQSALATVAAKRAELEANGQLVGAKRLEMDAAQKSAEVKVKEAEIAEVTAKKMKDLADVHIQLGRDAGSAVKGIDDVTKALGRQSGAADDAGRSMQRLRNTSSGGGGSGGGGLGEGAPGNPQSDEYERKAQEAERAGQHLAAANFRRMADRERHIAEGQQKSRDIRYAAVNETDINQQIVKRYGEDALDDPLTREAWTLRLQLQAYQKNYGGPRSAQSLLEQRNIAAELERVEREIEAKRVAREKERERERKAKEKSDSSSDGPFGSTSGSASGSGSRSSGIRSPDANSDNKGLVPGNQGLGSSNDSGSGGGGVSAGGVSYISHITIPGIGSGTTRHADRESAMTEESLLRKLAQAKSVHIPR